MKIIGILLIIGILFSYVPVFPMDDCQEEDNGGNMKLGCGYAFHCPFLSNIGLSGSIVLPYVGRASLSLPLPVIDELAHPIFHPPKSGLPNLNYGG
jgi:hypothetical protein